MRRFRVAFAVGLSFASSGCGGEAFTTAIGGDAGDVVDGGPDEASAAGDADTGPPVSPRLDAGDERAPAPERDASSSSSSSGGHDAGDAQAIDSGSSSGGHDAGGDGPPAPCAQARCPVCPIAAGYACCTLAGACGCELPSAGGYCQ